MSKKQDSLLRRYVESVGGVIFTEVAVGERSRHGERRYIDGVRVVPPDVSPGEVQKLHGEEFRKRIEGKTVEAIEVDYDLNRWVIGQAVVGKHMLEIQYGVHAAIPVVVCKVRDEPLEQACARLGVKVWWTRQRRFLVPVASASEQAAA
jgi:hypothetical protein